MTITLRSTDEFKHIGGQPHRVWVGRLNHSGGGAGGTVTAYIHHIEVTAKKHPEAFSQQLKRLDATPD